LPPRADLVRAAPGLSLVDNDSVVGKEHKEGVEVARGLGREVALNDGWG
jgi:hypothetical protein